MAHNEIVIDAPRDAVWDMLADGRSYGHWVVGSSEIRHVEPAFPNPGSRFHHKVGIGPFKVADHTLVMEATPTRHLRLRARARPLGTAFVDLTLQDEDTGRTRILMKEGAADPLTRLVLNPLTDPLVKLRNAESLRRLKRMVEHGDPHPADAEKA